MRKRKWSKTAIDKAFNDFVEEHGRLPARGEMYGKYRGMFPRPLSVKLNLGISIGEYIKENYGEYVHIRPPGIYADKPNQYWIDNFKKQYLEYGCPSESEYNKLRTPGTPNTETLAKLMDVLTWTEALNYCGFRKKEKAELKGGIVFEETYENCQKLNRKLQEILTTLQ